mmetsp:Transcript_41223/g.110157  ORF Transcript_41223/g.110157 Transcript_41223/m.110157 type:complete len:257 (-) Transcript_41223:142-912(-)
MGHVPPPYIHIYISSVAADGVTAALGRRLATAGTSPLLEVALVVLLRGEEHLGLLELGVDGRAAERGLDFGEHRLRLLALLGGVVVDAVAVLRTLVVADLVLERGVDLVEEQRRELLHRHLGGVVRHLHDLGVACHAAAHRLVRRVGKVALRVAHGGACHPRHALEHELHAPEAPASECCDGVSILGNRLHFVRESILRSLRRECPRFEVGIVSAAATSHGSKHRCDNGSTSDGTNASDTLSVEKLLILRKPSDEP